MISGAFLEVELSDSPATHLGVGDEREIMVKYLWPHWATAKVNESWVNMIYTHMYIHYTLKSI